jgi:hypothetical protein
MLLLCWSMGLLQVGLLTYPHETILTRYRDDKLLYKPECYCGPGQTARDEITGVCSDASTKQDDWDAWWFDIKTPACLENIKEVHTARMVDAHGKGCDAIDPDNVDGVCCHQDYPTGADTFQGVQ